MPKAPEGPVFYVAEEAAFAPGIAAGWPAIIPAPHTKRGRLVKVGPELAKKFSKLMDKAEKIVECEDCGDRTQYRITCHHCKLKVCRWCWSHVHQCEPGHKRAECRDLKSKKRSGR